MKRKVVWFLLILIVVVALAGLRIFRMKMLQSTPKIVETATPL